MEERGSRRNKIKTRERRSRKVIKERNEIKKTEMERKEER